MHDKEAEYYVAKTEMSTRPGNFLLYAGERMGYL